MIRKSKTSSADTAAPPAAAAEGFRPGLWWALGDGVDCYYRISADGSGSVTQQEDGAVALLNWETEGDAVRFRYENENASASAEIHTDSADTLTLVFGQGHTEHWQYQGDKTIEQFRFISNAGLCTFAKMYLYRQTGHYVNGAQATADETDPQIIAIRLYDDMGDHTAASAWYYVNRFTGKGTDLLGDPVDLSALV